MRRYTWLWFGIFVAALLGTTHMALAQPPGGGPGGGRGRGGRPFEIGKVAAVSEDGTTLTIASEFGQNATVTVTASDQTLYYTAWDVELKDIAVGDVISLRGTPVKIQADTAQVGTDVQSLVNPPGPGGAAPAAAPPTPQPAAFGMVTGTVAKTDPLTVDVNGLQVEVELAEGATLTEIAPMDQPAVAVGDRVIVAGSRPQGAGPDTPLGARVIIVDTTAKGLQLFRGRGRPGGPGGPPG